MLRTIERIAIELDDQRRLAEARAASHSLGETSVRAAFLGALTQREAAGAAVTGRRR